MFKLFHDAWKVKELRDKILYTLMILAIVRLGTVIYLPGLNLDAVAMQTTTQTILTVVAGGANSRYTIFSMGIGPYITSSIIMQLLTIAIPRLEQLQKEGEEGRKKIQNYSRYLTVALAFFQSAGLTNAARVYGLYLPQEQLGVPMPLVYIVSVLTMMAGTTFIMWLAEQITKNGIGNGSSMIIFVNIISSFPQGALMVYTMLVYGGTVGIIKAIALIVAFIFVIAFVVLIQEGERRLPVQYSKKMVGRRMYGGQSSYIPIKVNTAGVISIIFSVSLLQFPETLGQFFTGISNTSVYATLVQYLSMSHPVGAVLYFLLIIFFTFFYTSIVFNPAEIAENMKKNGGFVPGIRPGQPTSEYITKIVNRVTFIGAICYVLMAAVPFILQLILQENISLGGTTLLIVVGVALDTVKTIESQLLMRHYKGFLNS